MTMDSDREPAMTTALSIDRDAENARLLVRVSELEARQLADSERILTLDLLHRRAVDAKVDEEAKVERLKAAVVSQVATIKRHEVDSAHKDRVIEKQQGHINEVVADKLKYETLVDGYSRAITKVTKERDDALIEVKEHREFRARLVPVKRVPLKPVTLKKVAPQNDATVAIVVATTLVTLGIAAIASRSRY